MSGSLWSSEEAWGLACSWFGLLPVSEMKLDIAYTRRFFLPPHRQKKVHFASCFSVKITFCFSFFTFLNVCFSLFNIFPNTVLVTHPPALKTCLIALISTNIHQKRQTKCVGKAHTDLLLLTIHNCTQAHMHTLSSSLLPVGVNTFFFLFSLYLQAQDHFFSLLSLHPSAGNSVCLQK